MAVPPRPPPPKKEVALALLEGESVFIHLDPRREAVLVPKQFVKQTQLVLQVGLKLAIRIPDLHIDDEGISCTLSFNRAPFWCRMPWASIYALVGPDGRGMLWPDDVPPEVAAQMRAGRGKTGSKRPRPRLAAVRDSDVDGEHEEGSQDAASSEAGDATPPSSAPETGEVLAPKRPRPRAVPTPPPALATVPPRRPVAVPNPVSSSRPDDPPPRGAHVKAPPARPPLRPQPTRPVGTPLGGAGKRPKRELPPYLRVVK